MAVKQFQGKSLLYLVIEPESYHPEADYPMVVMLHGYASSMNDVAGLAPGIDPEGYIFACPNAPIPFQVHSGRVGYGWSSPGSSQWEEEEEEARASEMLDIFFDEVFEQYRVKSGRALLMGFSQGGSLSLRCGLPKPDTFAGLATLSGYLPQTGPLQARLPAERAHPIFVAHGTRDQYIPLQQAQEVRDFLEAQGYAPRYKEYDMRHEISPDVMGDLMPWIKTVLPPFGASP